MMMELKAGAKIGRYELLTHIARGGMADVWLARASGPVGFQKTVVIKSILPHLADDPEFVRMFIDEAVIAAQLDHPNIVHIFDLGEIDGSYFIAMEYIDGRSLRNVQRELHKTRRVPPPWFVLRSISSACEALHHAHKKRDGNGKYLNLVHRDVSPENIMVSFTGETKVLDFGIAKVSTVVSKTRVGVVKGKYAYMAPEQIETVCDGAPLDARIDIYALGVVMYELLTGRRPYRGANDLALLRQILAGNPEPPASFCNWIPEPLSQLILKAMARVPSDRFSSAGELQQCIEEFLASQGFHPTHLHVAAFMRSLFGEESVGASSTRPPASSARDEHAGTSSPPPQPAEGKEESLSIDVSLLLDEEEVAAGGSTAPAVGAGKSPAVSSTSSRPARLAPKAQPPALPSHTVSAPAKASPKLVASSGPQHAAAEASRPAAAASSKVPPNLPPQPPPEKRSSKRPPRGQAPQASPTAAAVASHGPFSSIVSRAAPSLTLPGRSGASSPSPATRTAAGERVVDSSTTSRVGGVSQAIVASAKPRAPAPAPPHPNPHADSSDRKPPTATSRTAAVAVVTSAPDETTAPSASPSSKPSSAEKSPSVALPPQASPAPVPVSALEPTGAAVSVQTSQSERDAQTKGESGKESGSRESAPEPAEHEKGNESDDERATSAPMSETGKHVWDRLMARVREQKSAETSETNAGTGGADRSSHEEPVAQSNNAATSKDQTAPAPSGLRPAGAVADEKAPASRDSAPRSSRSERESDSVSKTDTGPKHVWDVLIERARDERETVEQAMENGGPESERSVVGMRPASSPDLSEHRVSEIKLDIRAGRARQAFENGLERLRKKDLDGALEEWSKAVELEPDNRAYQSNVRMLKKQVAERRR